jgi:hypothetical protein
VTDHRSDQLAGQSGRHRIALDLGKMALEDRIRGALPEVSLEDRGERGSTARASSALSVSLRRHRR